MKYASGHDKLLWGSVCGIAVIFVLLPFHAVFTTWLGTSFGHLDLFRIWKEILLVPLGIAALWLGRHTKTKDSSHVQALITLMVAYALLHVAVGLWGLAHDQVNGSALVFGLLTNIRFLVFFVICYRVASQTTWLWHNWQKLIIWPALIVIGFGLLQQYVLPMNFLTRFGYGPTTIPAYHTIDQKPQYQRLQSTLRGPNPLGAYLVVILITLVALLLQRKNHKYWYITAVITASIVLFFTYSRSAWLGAALGLGLLVYWSLQLNRRRAVLLGLAALTIVLGGLTVSFRNNDLLQNMLFHTDETSQSSESSNAVRTQALTKGFQSLLREPLGQGPGTAGPASFRNDNPARISENYFIQIGQEVGILGLLLFVAINIGIARELWVRRDQLLSLVLLTSLAGLTLINLISHAWADDTLGLIFWGLAGIAIASHKPTPERIPKLFNRDGILNANKL